MCPRPTAQQRNRCGKSPGPGLPRGPGGLQERPCAATASVRGLHVPTTQARRGSLRAAAASGAGADDAALGSFWGPRSESPRSGWSASVIVPGSLSLHRRLLLERTLCPATPGTADAAVTTRRPPSCASVPAGDNAACNKVCSASEGGDAAKNDDTEGRAGRLRCGCGEGATKRTPGTPATGIPGEERGPRRHCAEGLSWKVTRTRVLREGFRGRCARLYLQQPFLVRAQAEGRAS